MRLLVTGATGQLGSFLVRRLLAEGHTVAALVRAESDPWRIADVMDSVHRIEGDLGDVDGAAAGIAAFAPEGVFHLGWYGVTGNRDAPAQVSVNLLGTLRLLEVALAAGCRLWAGVGSQAEYGPVEGPLREGMPTAPTSLYGTAKLCAGLLTGGLCAAAGVRHLWFRLLATYGPADEPRRLIPSVALELLAGREPALTAGEQRWDYLYVDDAVDALVRAALHSGAEGVYNLASGEAHPVREIVETIRDAVDPALPLRFGALPYPPGQTMLLVGDTSRLRADTGWAPRTPLAEGLERTVRWYAQRAAGPTAPALPG